MKKFLLIDGFGVIFRSYYAFISKPLTNSKGENVSAIFGFFKTLFSIINKIQPEYFLIALEGKGKCFRKDIYPNYKANRDATPEDLKIQIQKIINLINLANLPFMSVDGYEADDIIGSLIKKIKKENFDNIAINIFSSDKDFQQLLVNNNVSILKPGKIIGTMFEYDSKMVKEKLGIIPTQFIDYLALIGDSADNIPGVKGIGPKTAVSLLQEWENLDGVYKNIDLIKSKKLQKKLFDNKKNAYLSHKLATIDCSISLDLEWNKWQKKEINLMSINSFLIENELNSIITYIKKYNYQFGNLNFNKVVQQNRNKKQDIEIINSLQYEYKVLSDINEIKKIILEIQKEKIFVFDLETTGLNFLEDEIICMSLSCADKIFVIPYQISEDQQNNVSREINDVYRAELIEILKIIFEDESICKIGQNLKFDIKFLIQKGIKFKGKLFDTMIAEYCLDASFNKLNMDDLAKKYLNYTTIKYKDIVTNIKKDTLLDIDFNILSNYSAQDAFITLKLYEMLNKELIKKKQSKKLFDEIEMPLLRVILNMEIEGVNIDKKYLDQLSKYFGKILNEIYSKIIEEAGEEFNPNSPKQLAKILFDKFKLTPIAITKTGPSTNIEVLKKLSLINPLPKLIIKYRMIKKLQSTYSDALIGMINSTTNKIHTTYMQTGTQTGRLSSKNPNLQNIPIRSEEGRKIRNAFIPSSNRVLISFDYSQIELFLLAEFSKDTILYESFKNGEDIHTKTASIIFNKSTNSINKEERSIAKTVNFGILYGQSAFSLSEELYISRADATNFIKVFFENYDGVKKYIEALKKSCEEKGYAETYWGRKRTISEIYEKNKLKKSYGERMAVNTTIQGSAADLIKIAMIRIQKEFENHNLNSKLILQVHDELIFDVFKDEIDFAIKIIKNNMEEGFPFSLKLRTTMKIGDNWGALY